MTSRPRPRPAPRSPRPSGAIEHVLELKPDICSLDFNTMWFGTGAVINSPRNLDIMAERIYAAGVKPELEVFDTGDIQLAQAMLDKGTCGRRRCSRSCSA